MPDYQQGKIYRIRSPNTHNVYIGSTIATLAKRFAQHKITTTKARQVIDCGDAYIELVHAFPCNSKDELFKEEARLIRETPNCINLAIPTASGRSDRAIIVHVTDDCYMVISERDKRLHTVRRSKTDPLPEGDTLLEDGTTVHISGKVLTGSNLFSACREYLYDRERRKVRGE
jgi:hypothetical protein